MFNRYESHSVGVNALKFMGRRGLSQAVKSDFAKQKIESVANNFGLWNPESTALESGIQLMESGIQPL